MSRCEDYPCCGHTPGDPCDGIVVMSHAEWCEAYHCDVCGWSHTGACPIDDFEDDEWDDELESEEVETV